MSLFLLLIPFQLKICLPSLIIPLVMLVINSPFKLYIFAETRSWPLLVMGIFISLLNGFGYGDNLLKKDWWKQAKKSKLKFRYRHLPGHPQVEVQVATASYLDSAPQAYVPDINLTTTVGGTLLLAAVLFVGSRGGI